MGQVEASKFQTVGVIATKLSTLSWRRKSNDNLFGGYQGLLTLFHDFHLDVAWNLAIAF